MKEFKTIVAEYRKIDFNRQKAAIATVVKVRGSSYRSPGARMLITDDGRWVGSISGGCLEGDALRKARQVMLDKKPMTVTYDTREESNQSLGIGLGCNGVIDVLIEPVVPADENNPIALFENFISVNEPVALATIYDGEETGDRLLLLPGKKIVRSFKDQKLSHIVAADLADVADTGKSIAKTYTVEDSKHSVFLELVQPSVSLIIFGAGFDARPVSQLAKSMGWAVMVTDECVAHVAPLFFPDADKLSLCHREFVAKDFAITPYTACILMSHNYAYDRDVLKKILLTPTPYIGILGPRKRLDKMLAEFEKEGLSLTAEDVHRIHAPIGLDIGAETPDEIALSIIAEVQGKFANRSGGFLKYRKGPIHQRDLKSDQVFKQVYLNDIGDRSSKVAR